ncbi:MAG: MaoC family dehydratase N-terminal domain-containing protein [Steroidobacteraceae bacterium]
MEHLRKWVGNVESRSDSVTAFPIAALAATLGREDPPLQSGDAVPPLWHWLYFLPTATRLGVDGHVQRGEFLPPVALPRRMWAGGRLRFHRPLHVGDRIQRSSTVAGVRGKTGRTGELIFVTVRHTISVQSTVVITEEQDLVFRSHPSSIATPSGARTSPGAPAWRKQVTPDEIMLFRYSALTFNAHRIHYDRSYATEKEGYPGLVVQAPLQATLLMELVTQANPAATIHDFTFRALQPSFDGSPLFVCGKLNEDGSSAALWTSNLSGAICMEATASLGPTSGQPAS